MQTINISVIVLKEEFRNGMTLEDALNEEIAYRDDCVFRFKFKRIHSAGIKIEISPHLFPSPSWMVKFRRSSAILEEKEFVPQAFNHLQLHRDAITQDEF